MNEVKAALTDVEISLMRWLLPDKGQYGECYGETLNKLIARKYAEVKWGREHQTGFIAQGDGIKYQAVMLTQAGIDALKELDNAAG